MNMLWIQGLLGLGCIGLGVYRFLNLDAARETRSRVRPTRSIEVWERRYITFSMLGIIVGIFFLGVSFASVFAPQPPAGEYICLPTNVSSDDENTFLVLRPDGTGTYDGLTLTWSLVNKTPIQVIFSGETRLSLGAFPVADDPKSFVVEETNGARQLCLLR